MKMTQKELARFCNTSDPKEQIKVFERGGMNPFFETRTGKLIVSKKAIEIAQSRPAQVRRQEMNMDAFGGS
tara:strand:- start:519 stop:731 length:213 start_codon:yes stop_codon:yes gene_type:complete